LLKGLFDVNDPYTGVVRREQLDELAPQDIGIADFQSVKSHG